MRFLLDGLSELSGIRFWTLWTALGRLLDLPWALLGRPGPPLERSWGTPGELLGLSWRSWGVLGAARGFPNPPGIDFGRILG